jgi:DNA-binding beta-propeller fold protein YncE
VRSLAALAATASGGVFVGDTSSDAIDEFAVGGSFVRTWGRSGRTPGRFTLPRSVALDAAGNFLVADTRNDRIERLRPDGSVIDVWGKISTLGFPTTGNGNREFRDPTAVAVDPSSGEVWTVEGGNHRVQRFAADGTWLATYGGVAAGGAPGQFTEPLGVAVGPGGEVLVADTRNDRLQRRDPGTGVWSVVGSFARPSAVAVGADGRRYVAEAGADRVRVLRPDGSTAATIDGLHAPEGVAVDSEGRVIVADTQSHRVLRYAPTGGGGYELETVLGGRGAEPGSFVLPIGVATDGAGAIWVVDAYNHRVQRFAPAGSQAATQPPAAGASAPVAAPTTARRRLTPRRLRVSVSPRRDRRAPYRFTVTGRLLRPAGVSAIAGCRGRVSVHVGARERVVSLRRDCTLRTVVRLARSTRAGRLRVRATFMGNAALEPRAARSLVVRLG